MMKTRSLSLNRSSRWRVGVALSALGLSVAASAAIAATPPAPAAPAAGQQLEEVIITARRRAESLQNVPQTVTAVTANDINKLGLLRFDDVTNVVAGLQITGNGGNLSASVRGVTFQVSSAAFSPTVAQYFNDAPVISAENAQALFDIGQVEVLRGPQGTLRGIAAPSGAITVSSHKPDVQKMGGDIGVSISNLHGRNFQGAVNFPIFTGKLAVRLAAMSDENDGSGVRSANSSTAPESQTSAQRISLRFTPTDNFSADLMYQRMRRRDLTFGTALYGAGATGGTRSVPSGAGFNNTGITTAGYNGPVLGPYDYRAVGEVPSDNQQNIDIKTAELSWSFAGQQLSYVGSMQKYDSPQFTAGDSTNAIPGYEPIGNRSDSDRINTHELRLASVDRVAGVLDYVVGVFNNYDNIVVKIPDNGIVALNSGAFGPPGVPFTPHAPNERYALHLTIDLPRITNELSYFGNTTVHLGDKFEVSAGTRYIHSKVHLINDIKVTPGFIALPFPAATCAAIGGQFGATYPGVCDRPIPASQAVPFGDNFLDHKAWIYDLSLAYHVNPDLMVYLHSGSSWREGPITIGIINATNDPTLASLSRLDPEKSRSNEVGLKWSFLERRGRLNVDYYHQTYDGLIYTPPFGVFYLSNSGSSAPTVGSIPNASKNAPAKVDGFDVEVAFELTKRWSTTGRLSWADGKLSNANVPCNDGNFDGTPDTIVPTVAAFQTAGKFVALCNSNAATSTAPKWNVNVQSEYSLPLTDRSDGFIRGLLNYQPSNPNASQVYVIPSYTMLNLYFGLRGKDHNWEAALYAKNATNTQKITSQSATNVLPVAGLSSVFGPSGYNSISLTPRREIGLQVNYSFD